MELPDLAPDCTACAALCCVALAFDKGARFDIDKPAGQPCPNLSRTTCKIHDQLADTGFSGCVVYDCLGAGQRTVALFDGALWQDDPALLGPQMETFAHLRRLHDMLGLLQHAGTLPLPPEVEARRQTAITSLTPTSFTRQTAAALATGPALRAAGDFLKSLAAYAPRAPQAGPNGGNPA